jgi:uroporphyrinogen-III decarboxylase
MTDKIKEYPVHALNWWDKGTTLTLQKAKQELSRKFCLVSGIDENTLLTKGSEQVEREVKEAIEVAASDGGFMLGPGCAMKAGTPEANISAAFEAAKKYGKY